MHVRQVSTELVEFHLCHVMLGSLLFTIITLSLSDPSHLDVSVSDMYHTQLSKYCFSRFISQVYKEGALYSRMGYFGVKPIHFQIRGRCNSCLRLPCNA